MGKGRQRTLRKGASVIVGPILSDLLRLGWGGGGVTIATAFYSGRALNALSVSAKQLQILCRLDVNNPIEWAEGWIAPDTLLQKLRSFEDQGTTVDLRVHRSAHAKVYAGETGVIIGSANLTLHGFGGGWEMVHASSEPEDVQNVRRGLETYAGTLEPLTLHQLSAFIAKHSDSVMEYRKHHPRTRHQDKVAAPATRPPRLGDYSDFLKWLHRQSGEAAQEIHARAHGKSNLQGHIDRNFFGLRQFFLAYPEVQDRFRRESPDTYKLSKDADAEYAIADYVKHNAADEAHFSLQTWKTYLPVECGGRAKRHGGTIGNLNRMLPLVARYMFLKGRQ